MNDIKNLFYENGYLSLGRLAFWVCFAISLYYWIVCFSDTPASLTTAMGLLLGYNLSKKAIDNMPNAK